MQLSYGMQYLKTKLEWLVNLVNGCKETITQIACAKKRGDRAKVLQVSVKVIHVAKQKKTTLDQINAEFKEN